MRRAKYTFAVLAFSTVVACTPQITPVTPPHAEPTVLTLYSTPSTLPLVSVLSSHYLTYQQDIVIETPVNQHDILLQRLLNHEIDYFVSSHLPTDDRLWAVPLAQDGLAVITAPNNPIQSLELDDLRWIFRGYWNQWNQVGDFTGEITLLSREQGSATRYNFERLVMGNQRTSPNAQIMPSNTAMITEVTQNPEAIGYLPISQLTEDIHTLSISGISPSYQTISDASYPLRYTIFIIGREESTDDYRNFIAWAQSAEGQATFIPQYAPLLP